MKRSTILSAAAIAAVGLALAATPSNGSTSAAPKAAPQSVSAAVQGLAAPVLGDNDRRTLPASCKYPPITKPKVTLVTSRTTAKSNQTFNLTGTVFANTCPLPGDTVGLYTNTAPTGTFGLVATTTVATNGSYAFNNRTITRTTYFVTQALPGYGLAAAQSSVVGVTLVR